MADVTMNPHRGPAQPAKPKVALAYVHADAGRVTAFEDSLAAMRDWDSAHGKFLHRRFAMRFGTDGLVAARNQVAAQLIQSDCDWLLWVDTDMGFAADSLDKLLMVADPTERPIVGGLCFAARQYAHDGMNGYWTKPQPTIYTWLDNPDGGSGFTICPLYPVNSIMQVAATGSAFILIHRSVFEKIAEQFGPTWYDRTPAPNGELLGEDISFCVRASVVEVPVHVHTGVRTSHYKGHWVQEKDHWRAYNPPPATEPTAVVVPVLGRPEHAQPFMQSLRASTGLATAYAVCETAELEVAEAWRNAGATILWDDDEYVDGEGHRAHTFAEKVNLAYRQTTEPWLLLVGSDVRFHPAWLDHAQHVGNVLEASVVGTNDVANERVMAGEHSPHPMIRRSYIDEVGASWDGPKNVCHEGYRHNFVDDEIVRAAKQRGVWQPALGSVVEHLHPIFGKAEDDEVYRLGKESWEADWELYKQRLRANS
jgi:GT2 family glycosyltransferase